MASINGKRMVAVATVATSLVLMGGTAFASPAHPTAGSTQRTAGLAPAPVDRALEAGRDTAADGQNQVKKAFAGSIGSNAVGTGRDTAADGQNQVKKAFAGSIGSNAVETGRNTAADGQNQVKKVFR
jgi:hypothetical protein